MAGRHYSADFPDPRGTMEALAIQSEAKRVGRKLSPLPVPTEIMVNIIEIVVNKIQNLIPAHNLFNPVYVGSEALAPALEIRTNLHAFCLVSERMKRIATKYLYRVIVIKNSYELACLHRTIRDDSLKHAPIFCYCIESLAVHHNIVSPPPGQGRSMSPHDFSFAILSILQRARRLTKFSLVPIGMEAQEYSYNLFLPRLETLGVLISNTPRLTPDQSPEDEVFAELLNLPSLGRNALQGGAHSSSSWLSGGHNDHLSQRTLSHGKAITTLDLRSGYGADWKDVGAIGLSFPCLGSLSTWYEVQYWSRFRLPFWWELHEMRSLRHLRIDIQVRNYWSDRLQRYRELWGHPDQPFDLCVLPNLETLRVPLRLFIESDETSMHRSSDVLPATLKTLVLFIDLQLHCAEPLDEEESEWLGHEGDEGHERSISDPRSCAQTIRMTIEFLQDIRHCARSNFRDLRTLTLEYKIDDDFGGRDWSFRNEAMGEFMARLQRLDEPFESRGINFSWIAL